ncbi:MAG TPA: hypothetical protein VEZ12_23480, partial [Herpetosiphonaceae bacterium]|nr:hypothetical protein [Herpetosiphonaceae bacterium]
VSTGSDDETYGLGWETGALGGVPSVSHGGAHPDAHTLAFIQPETRRGAVLLINANAWLPSFGTFQSLEEGVARLLAGQEQAAASSMPLGTLYLIVDAVLAGLFALALWPLLQMRRWYQRLQAHQQAGRRQRLRVGLRLVWEIGMPLTLLLGARLMLHILGAQSWGEGLLLFPDVGVWLWAISLLVLLTGATRFALTLRLLRHADGERGMAAPASTLPATVPPATAWHTPTAEAEP